MPNTYVAFVRNHARPVVFGGMLTFFSSLGQTFYVSLFVPFVLVEFNMTKSVFGTYYALATILASVFLVRFGKAMDYLPVKKFTFRTLWVLVISSIIFASAYYPWMFFIAMIGLRFGGQGLFPHICFSALSRRFSKDRGKAISLASMGFSIGEMVFPLLIGLVISMFNWRVGFMVGTGSMLIFMLPFLLKMDLSLLDPIPRPKSETEENKMRRSEERAYLRQIGKTSSFYMMILPVMSISFVTTGLFFYQYVLAEERGWSMELYSLLFSGYAVARLLFTLFGGWLTDHFTAKRIFPFYPFPMALGVLVLALVPGIFGAGFFLVMTGITMGLNGVLRTSVVAEVYGVERIGHLQSLFTFLLVLSSALAPPLYGYLLDQGISFTTLNLYTAAFLVLIAINAFRLQSVPSVP